MKNEFDSYADFYDKWNEAFSSDIPLWQEYAEKCGSPRSWSYAVELAGFFFP